MLLNVHFILPLHYQHQVTNNCIAEFRTKVDSGRISSYSLCGFSRGAYRVYDDPDLGRWKYIGLIDPVPPLTVGQNTVLDALKERIRGVYRLENWGTLDEAPHTYAFNKHLREIGAT